ncbi:MAG: EAL domain-containing protein [Methylococcales bacterium]
MDNFNILYLDSNKFIASQVKKQLEYKGYCIDTANTEQQIFTDKSHHHYDLLIVDFLTPTPNAFSFLGYLKGKNIALPTIIVNSEKDSQLITKAMHLGCIDYVIKPPSVTSFINQLKFSIFQSIVSIQNDNTRPILPASAQNTSKTINWQYILAKDQVNFFSSLNKTISYQDFISNIHIDDIAQVKTKNNICLFSHQPVEYNFRYLSDNKETITYHASIKADVNTEGIVKRLYGFFQQDNSTQAVDPNLRLKLSFLEHTKKAVFITDKKRNIISINDAFTNITGYSEQDALSKKSDILNTSYFNNSYFKNVATTLKNKSYWEAEVLIRHKNANSIPVWESIYVLTDNTGKISQSISVLRDISQQKAIEKSIKSQANYDALTHLPNRTLFRDRLKHALNRAKRSNKKLALLLLDLNKFKWVNDNLGHHVGDVLLQETSKKLLTATRKSDTVARLGGDEFCMVLPELEKITDAELIARKIFNLFKKPIIIDQQEVYISGSIGISIFPDDGTEIDTLQKNADSAMYIAKSLTGNNSFYYYTPALQQETEKRLKLIDDMHSALRNHEFSLHFQPIIDLNNGKVSSAETLLRWNHPEAGYIPLNLFIPVAEECGLIREIGNWVINEVSNTMQRWSALGLDPIQISLNQSVAQYNLPGCHLEWIEILNNKQIPTSHITFEVSEKIFLDEQQSQLKSIEKLKQAGIQISLDSFGTGYSSLNYLKKIPVDAIKIDRSYIHNMVSDPTYSILVDTIVILANKLGIKVIATGIETKEQLDLLHPHCQYAQGYYFSKPLPPKEFESFVKQRNI